MRLTPLAAFISGVSLLVLPSHLNFNSNIPFFTSVSPQLIPDDEKINQQTGLQSIDLSSAWDITLGSSEVVIAIIDDAIEVNHPDLNDNMLPGWDFVDGDNDPSPGQCVDPATQITIKEEHGTSVAGIIGAVGNNSLGIAGINWRVKILPIRIGCTYAPAFESLAIRYAIQQGADIINASYAGPDFLVRNEDAIRQLNEAKNQVLFVTAAGNHHTDNDISPMYPSNLQAPNIITVASSNNNKQLSHWSQFGASNVTLAAPGENLLSTLFSQGSDNDYGAVSGTSFSTAVVSGVAGLIKAVDYDDGISDLAPGDIKGILMASATPINGQTGVLQSDAIVNAYNALTILNDKQPVISVTDIEINDSDSQYPNGSIDSSELFTVDLRLENLWDDIFSLQLELQAENKLIKPIENKQIREFWPKNSSQQVSFHFRADDFNDHQTFHFNLIANMTGSKGNRRQERKFSLTSGPLSHKNNITDTIQRHSMDELRQWHFNIPAEANKVAIEIERDTIDERRLGLLASIGKFPKVYFKGSSGKEFLSVSDFRMYSDKQFERLDFNVASLRPETINLLVFNKPIENASEKDPRNKSYRLRACYFTDNDTNRQPVVDAGTSLTVNPGEKVELEGSASDPDGEITRIWWSSASDIEFDTLISTKISLVAPQSGTATFVLSAIDDNCRKTADSVTITVKDENSGETGLQINPKRIEIEEGSSISVQVSANYQSIIINDLQFISGPDGLVFEKSNNQDSFDRLIWQNTAEVGTYVVRFNATIEGNVVAGRIVIDIRQRGSKSSGGGCSVSKNKGFDPFFLIILSFSCLILFNPRRTRVKNLVR